jgi:CRISPR-associated protein Csd2
MRSRKLFVFKHDSALDNAPAHKLFDLVKIERKDKTKPARQFDDYSVTIERDSLPSGVTLEELI